MRSFRKAFLIYGRIRKEQGCRKHIIEVAGKNSSHAKRIRKSNVKTNEK